MKESNNNGNIKGLIVVMILLTLSWSCTKNEKINLAPGLNTANDILLAQRPLIHSFRMLVRAVSDSTLQQSHQTIFDGASVTYNPSLNRYSFYFMGMYCPDSVIRSGKIDMALSGDFFTQGTIILIIFNNYKEDGMGITGSDTLTNTGLSGLSMLFSNSFTDGSIVKDTVGTISFRAGLEYQVPVSPPGGYSQTLITVDGTMEGTSSKGFVFGSEISSPLIYPVYSSVCAWVRQGTIVFTVSEGNSNTGTICFPPVTSCNDSVYYDLGTTTYRWRMTPEYLNH